MGCRGVTGLRGLGVTATGWMYLDGEHVNRAEVKRLVKQQGARFHPDFSESTDLLLLGELRPHNFRATAKVGPMRWSN